MSRALPHDVLASLILVEHRTLMKGVMSPEEWALHSAKICSALDKVFAMVHGIERLGLVRAFVSRSIANGMSDVDVSGILAGSADWLKL